MYNSMLNKRQHADPSHITTAQGKPLPEFTALATWLVSGRFSVVTHQSVTISQKANISCISLTGISFVAIQIQLIPTRRRLHPFIPLNRIHPCCPASAGLWIRPATVRLQHASHADYPRRHLDVDEGDVGAEEEGAGGVCRVDEFRYLEFQVFCGVDLFLGVLRLEVLVEYGDDVAVDLEQVESEVMFVMG